MDKDVLTWVERNVANIETRDYQVETWSKLKDRRTSNRKRALIHLATGLGKTSVAAVDAFHYLKAEKPNGRVLFVSHMNDISRQAKDTFHGSVKNVDVTFSTFQALYRQLDTIEPDYFSYIIWDEAHHIEVVPIEQLVLLYHEPPP